MDLLGSIMGSMDKPPTASEREKKMKKMFEAKRDKHLELEQKKRTKFKLEAEKRVKRFVSDDSRKEIVFPKQGKVYRAILHEIAEAAGLYSHSTGEGEEKDITFTKEPVVTEATREKTEDVPITQASATPPASDYRDKYKHLIGGLECAEKTAVKMEPNRAFGYVPSANKRDHRSIEETMNDLRTKKKPKLDPSLSDPASVHSDIADLSSPTLSDSTTSGPTHLESSNSSSAHPPSPPTSAQSKCNGEDSDT